MSCACINPVIMVPIIRHARIRLLFSRFHQIRGIYPRAGVALINVRSNIYPVSTDSWGKYLTILCSAANLSPRGPARWCKHEFIVDFELHRSLLMCRKGCMHALVARVLSLIPYLFHLNLMGGEWRQKRVCRPLVGCCSKSMKLLLTWVEQHNEITLILNSVSH